MPPAGHELKLQENRQSISGESPEQEPDADAPTFVKPGVLEEGAEGFDASAIEVVATQILSVKLEYAFTSHGRPVPIETCLTPQNTRLMPGVPRSTTRKALALLHLEDVWFHAWAYGFAAPFTIVFYYQGGSVHCDRDPVAGGLKGYLALRALQSSGEEELKSRFLQWADEVAVRENYAGQMFTERCKAWMTRTYQSIAGACRSFSMDIATFTWCECNLGARVQQDRVCMITSERIHQHLGGTQPGKGDAQSPHELLASYFRRYALTTRCPQCGSCYTRQNILLGSPPRYMAVEWQTGSAPKKDVRTYPEHYEFPYRDLRMEERYTKVGHVSGVVFHRTAATDAAVLILPNGQSGPGFIKERGPGMTSKVTLGDFASSEYRIGYVLLRWNAAGTELSPGDEVT